jgi:excisionase family DNA binding protein
MPGPQARLDPIRPSEAEKKDISELHLIMHQWFITMPEVDRQEKEAAERYFAPVEGAVDEEVGVSHEATEGSPPWTWSECTLRLPSAEIFALPPSVANGLYQILDALAHGDAVAVVPLGADLTTQEAANLLGVSRPYLIRLTDQGEIPCHWVGAHRRLRVEDVLEARRNRQGKQRVALRAITEKSEAQGLRYSPDD